MKPTAADARSTDYGEFFDMRSLRAAVPTISTDEFIAIEGRRLSLPLRDEKAGGPQLHGVGRNVSWVSAASMCAAEGRELCGWDAVCPPAKDGTKRTPRFWAESGRLHGDHWVPILGDLDKSGERIHDWVELGDSAGRQCQRHSK